MTTRISYPSKIYVMYLPPFFIEHSSNLRNSYYTQKLYLWYNFCMKKTLHATIFAFLLIISFGILVNNAQATVGGPTIVYDFKYDSKTSSIYYTEQNYNGKGCPPELKSISLSTLMSKVVYSCNDGLVTENQSLRINSFTSQFTTLVPINLRRNNIDIVVDVIGIENIPDTSEKIKTNFIARVFQGSNKISEITFSGCNAEQPLVVGGYEIPGVSDKIVLLFSRKSDCWEGGYVGEFIFLVSGVNIVDRSHVNSYKSDSPLIPDDNSLVLYSKKDGGDQTSGQSPKDCISDKEFPVAILVLSVIGALVLGIIVGRLSRKNNNKLVS